MLWPDALAGEELAQDIEKWGYDSVLVDNHFKGLTKLEDDGFDLVLISEVYAKFVRETVLRSIHETLRNYDQVGELSNERIVLFSGDCDFEAMKALLKRTNDLIQELQSKNFLLQKIDLSLEGIFLSVQVRSKDYKSFFVF